MAESTERWPLPSESKWVQRILHLAEGMIVAGGITILLIQIFISLLGILFAVIDGYLLPIILALPIIVFLFGRMLLPLMVTEWDADWPPEYQDWGETRQWRRVAIIALVISVLHLGVLVLLWRWWSIVSFEETFFPSVGLVLAGFILHQYVFYRIGVTQ